MKRGRPKKKDWVIKNGGAEVYLTSIETVKNHPIIYHYNTKDPKEAMRFTEEEAREIAQARKALAIKIKV